MTHPVDRFRKRSIFQAIFVPLIFIMVLQSGLFYLMAIYGGVERSLNQNAADILQERLSNRKNELEGQFTGNWSNLTLYVDQLGLLYQNYQAKLGTKPFPGNYDAKVQFLNDASPILIQALRSNQVNGVFLILNDKAQYTEPQIGEVLQETGLCIRDLDLSNRYTGLEDLLVERCPSAVASQLGCSLDSWWEARYTFKPDNPENDGQFFYRPLQAAWENQGSKSEALAYFCGAHTLSGSDPEVVSYSLPLVDENGYPYGVLGVELTLKYLASLLPNRELTGSDQSCYILGLYDTQQKTCAPIVSSGALFNRFFVRESVISCGNAAETGGFTLEGRDGTRLYSSMEPLRIYDNNNPFDDQKLVLLALVEADTLFSYGQYIRHLLLLTTLVSLLLGIIGIYVVSRQFAQPITALAIRAKKMNPQEGFSLGHLGLREIDQLVDSIEVLNQNFNKETARTEFFSRMSHDMRTPMNAIIGFSSPVLLETADTAQKDDCLAKIHTSGQYLLGLINEVLDMTKIESNQIDLHCAPVRTTNLWDPVLPVIDKLASEKGVRFTTRISSQPEEWLVADVQHLNQIVMNLLSNAVKFTPANGLVVFQSCFVAIDAETVRCLILVQDSGQGMSEEFLKKLYTPFEQENSGLEGTGLGLAITKKLVDLMGGTISCTSQKNLGTAFRVTLPMKRYTEESPPAPAAAQKPSPVHSRALAGRRVLLCEDHPLNTQIAVKLLERCGIHVYCAANGREGVARFRSSSPGFYDAILMDIRMPVMDGLQAAAAIRQLDRSDSLTIPIVAMTANAFAEDMEMSRRAGMNAHLSKPIDPETLYHTLEDLWSLSAPSVSP